MKLAIVGSRDYLNLPHVRRYVLAQAAGTVIVSGGARGVDREAETAAYLAGFAVQIFVADWSRGKDAGYLRNFDIVHAADLVTVFWDGFSRGTAHTLGIARAANKLRDLFICRRKPLILS